ncbi:MAG: DUF86 domain-containing protein [Balneolaceae bacterium]
MVDRDVVFAKISSVKRCLKRIRDVTQLDPDSLDDLDTQEIMILNLQRAVQSTIDLAAHIVSDEGLGMPKELRENFELLSQQKIIPDTLSQNLRKMVGFRNIAVHEYETIDVEILKSILKKDLKDLETFYTTIVRYYNLTKE